MLKQEVAKRFGSQHAVARLLGISDAAVSQWGDRVPERHAARLEKASNGDLVYRVSDYQRKKLQPSASKAA